MSNNRHIENKLIRSIDGNKLVLNCNSINYKLRMLEANRIPGLLPLEIRENDGTKELCYDITSREAFGSIGAVRTLKMDDVRGLVYSLHHILKNLDRYLLEPNDLILDKDYIYVCDGELAPGLCYLPDYAEDFTLGLSTLLQDILGMVDHNDHDAVVMAYSLYQESLKPGYVIGDLLKLINNESSDKKTADTKVTNEKDALNREDARMTDQNRKEKSTDEMLIEYDKKASAQQLKSSQERETMFNAVNKSGRRKHSTIFSR